MTTEPRHVSHSQLSTAFGDSGCLRAWAYRYVEKLSTPVSGRLHVGTSWDRMTRLALDAKITAHDPDVAGAYLSVDEAIDIVETTFLNPPETSKDGAPLEYDFSDVDLDNTQSRLAYAAEKYVNDILPTIVPVSVQKEIRFPLLDGEDRVDLLGYIDLIEMSIDGNMVITDNKASMSGRASYNAEKAITDQQLTFYQAVMAQTDPANMYTSRGWRVVDIGYKTQQAKFSAFFVREQSDKYESFAKATIKNAQDQASTLLAVEKNGVFPPTGRGSWKCSERWCGYYDVCEYGRRGRTAIPIIVGDDED